MTREREKREKEYEQKLLDLARVTRVVKGGRRFRFRAVMVIGNRRGKVGVGVAKGADVSIAVEKAVADAKKNLISIGFKGSTIPHQIQVKSGSAKIILKPAREGRGVIAGGAVRAVAKLAGIKDISAKVLSRSTNKLNIARATIEALRQLKDKEIIRDD